MIENSFVKWINTFPNLSKTCQDLPELSDGIILNEICVQLAPKYFDIESLRQDVLDNWVLKSENIRLLVENLERFYTEELGITTPLNVDIDSISNSDPQEIAKLVEYILHVTMESENKNDYIENIMTLDQDTQNDLMIVIEKIQSQHQSTADHSKDFEDGLSIGRTGDDQDEDQEDIMNTSYTSHHQKDKDDRVVNLESQVERLRKDKDDLQNDLDEIKIQLSNITNERDRITQDKEKTEEVCQNLHQSLIILQKELDQTMAQTASLSAMNDETIKREMAELHIQIEAKDKQLQDLKKRLDESQKLSSENRSLRDEIDILREKAANAELTEEKLKKHQKKIEEIGDLRKKIKELEDQNDNYIQQTLDLEEQLTKSVSFKSQADSTKQQMSSLKIEIAKLELSLKSMKEDRDKLSENFNAIELEKNSLESEVQNLRNTLSEVQQENESKLLELQMNLNSDGGIGDQVVDSSTKERIARLERENKKLKEGSNDQVVELTNQLEEANLIKEDLVKKVQELEVVITNNGSSTPGNNNNSSNTPTLNAEQSSEIEALRLQLAESNSLVESTKRQLEETNLSLDEFKKQVVEMSQKQQSNESSEKFIEENTNLKSENDRLEGYLRAARNIIKDLREKNKSNQNKDLLLSEKDEYINKLENSIKQNGDVREQLMKQLKEGREESQREINLMLSAFLKLGLDLEQMKIQHNPSKEPRSFLNKKRGD
ncbi:hypothetical protein CYY_007284 [Polysphondylium violaceum]|uniref:Calponin-homology (CH) domain-containing protein n=1 Tax=Polysphondylium violaceum TaxID=133409 RepID=A0A8J4PR61_9MYCE|nr:hypothetical protein CYY_007284 [Polysphondylium violaceum]